MIEKYLIERKDIVSKQIEKINGKSFDFYHFLLYNSIVVQ